MHWGSASSRDLLHWEAGDIALFPDRDGTMFSGSGWRDDENAAGFGPGALLFYYTCAGGTQAPWSRDGVFTQRLAVSVDGGRTLEKQPGLLLPNLVHDNRDPKVFRHEASGAYIMTLYLAGNDYAIFRSPDLIHWEQTQQLTLPEAWECPDLFPLTVEGRKMGFLVRRQLLFCGDRLTAGASLRSSRAERPTPTGSATRRKPLPARRAASSRWRGFACRTPEDVSRA